MTQDRLKYFRIEAADIVAQLTQGALDLEKQPAPGPVVQRLLRLAHTLKGAARVVQQLAIADRAHVLEDALAAARDSGTIAGSRLADRILPIVDEMQALLGQLPPPAGQAAAPIPPRPIAASVMETSAPQAAPAQPPPSDDVDVLLGGIGEAQTRVRALPAGMAVLARSHRRASGVVERLRAPVAAAGTETTRSRAGLRDQAETLRDSLAALERNLTSQIDQLDRALREVRERAERMRLTPARALGLFLERATRDAAQALARRVTFEAHGVDTRVDGAVLQIVQGALLHVVRNAVAHGIESEEDRRRAGKEPAGRIALRIVQRGTTVTFSVSDDGRGVDLQAVRAIVRARGLDSPGEGPDTTARLLELLLQGGISTSTAVNEIAGRGVGLDAVRDAARALGGHLSARTEPLRGTTIELAVPLSMAALTVVMVDAGGQTVALPLEAVRGTRRIERREVVDPTGRPTIDVDGTAVPLISLRRALVPHTPPDMATTFVSAIVIQSQRGMLAVVVDRVVRVAEVVMHPLPALAPSAPTVAGLLLDELGNAQLVLDPDGFVDSAAYAAAISADRDPSRIPILVIDDSLTSRMLEQSILEAAGYQVETATSGEEGLEKARARTHALFLVDVEMPGMDGFTFVEQTRADPSLQQTPAILVTSRNAPEDLQRGRDAGAGAYMVKSEFDQQVLLDHIRRLVH